MSNGLEPSTFFTGRIAVIATMHQKERAIAPLLESALDLKAVVPSDFDTDAFGTFTREVKRPSDQMTTARLKADAALQLTNETLAIASEGSFGPHPQMPFVACDREVVLLRDRHHNLEIVGQVISTDTNYSQQRVTSLDEAIKFAQKIGFPSHGVVAMSEAHPTPSSQVFKGITDDAQLREAVTWLLQKIGEAHLETDMRAMHNPTRINVIAQATHDLIAQINQCCPECGFPGFAPVAHKPGLPCAWCGSPTGLTLATTYHCQTCDFSHDIQFPDGRQQADPAHCFFCNP